MANKLKIKEDHVSTKVSLDKEKSNEPEQIQEGENNIFNPEGELVIDVFETDSNFVVLTAIAGIQIKDIDISVEKDMMVIKGNRLNPHLDPEKKYFYQECYWGPFSRRIVLPENIEVQKAAAQMDKGLLTIKIPKLSS
ncbi:MAG: Hsp20/alpha crystallin family protein [Candidatus Staskawiczbacteria bacterium]|nr:Hsp20/alpha crystallin family protein [Candidatus Staskawiczbacteria bacterium]MBI3337626.1 Hsp20/alpha crystallin family protein [Candidatus Staskawiczbacteria bacterium]